MKKILIIGASSSIGCPLTEYLLKKGFYVIAHYNSPNKKLDSLSVKHPQSLKILKANLLRNSEVDIILAEVTDSSPLYAIVHLPSKKLNIQPIHKISWDDFDTNIKIQLRSIQQIVSLSIQKMKKAGDGKIISLGTEGIKTDKVPKGLSPYLVAKAAVYQYMRSLEAEVSERGIKIHQIMPMMFRSPLLNNLPNYLVEQTIQNQSYKNKTNVQDSIVSIIGDIIENKVDYPHEIFFD